MKLKILKRVPSSVENNDVVLLFYFPDFIT